LKGILFVTALLTQLCSMKKGEIHLWDIKRILFGQAPPEFLLEVFIRSLIIYLAAIVLMRWLGKRMNGQLTILEYAVMIVMGATIAVPMQIPDRGLVQGFVVMLCILLFLRGINWIAFHNSRFEKLVQGEVSLLVKDGVLNLKELNREKITHQQVFEVLRTKKIFQLGEVKRMYLEACGVFSVYQQEKPAPGLPLFPPDDRSILDARKTPDGSPQVCTRCGTIMKSEHESCPNCGGKQSANAIL
jgi:uncharacterized membrane protein YcaP (DUF421 family)